MEKLEEQDFYRKIQGVARLTDAFEAGCIQPVPKDWIILMTDVVDSTRAIEAGRYKEVNSAGGLAVMALANLTHGMEFPFIFGGDGMIFLLPAALSDAARDVLTDTRRLVASLLRLELRIGIVPVRDLYAEGLTLGVGKVRVSVHYDQAIINGTAVDQVDRWIKTPGNSYLVASDFVPETRADFDGFSCRWEDIPSHLGTTMALLVRASSRDEAVRAEVIRQVYNALESVLGSAGDYEPVSIDLQRVSRDGLPVRLEAGAMARRTGGLRYLLWKLWVRLQRTSTRLILRYGIDFPFMGKNVRFVREDNRVNADYRKFDGTLKMVVACTEQSRDRIEQILERFHEAGFIDYGTHSSDRAVMTCLVHVDSSREVHFIDAAGGGYALAAAKMKSQMNPATP